MKNLADNFFPSTVLAYAQKHCPKAQLVECVDVVIQHPQVTFKDKRGRIVVAPIYSPLGKTVFGLKSLLRAKRRGGPVFYHYSGLAANPGALQLAFWGENPPELLRPFKLPVFLSPS